MRRRFLLLAISCVVPLLLVACSRAGESDPRTAPPIVRVAQVQLGVKVDDGARAELQSAMQGTLQRLKVLTVQAMELDSGSFAVDEYRRRSAALATLEESIAELGRTAAKAQAQVTGRGALLGQDSLLLARVFDMADDGEMRMLIAENIAREGAAVQRERAAADTTLAWVRWLWLGAAAVLAGATLIAAVYFGRALRYPLLQLNEGAQALQSGKLSHRIPLVGHDEFASVAQSVNALAAELEQHRERESVQRQRLEDLVAARTAELAAALAHRDDVVTLAQFARDCAAERAACADEDDLHEVLRGMPLGGAMQ